MTRYYAKRQYQPIWTTASGLSRRGESVLPELRAAGDDGLTASDYLIAPIADRAAKQDPVNLADLEVIVALAATRYAHDLGWGITLASEVDQDNAYGVRAFDASEVLDRLTQAADPGAALHDYERRDICGRDAKLLAALARRSQGTWEQ